MARYNRNSSTTMVTTAGEYEYTPRQVSRPGDRKGLAGLLRLCGAGQLEGTTAGALLARWWSLTTETEFLASTASRRDLWKMLLPIPAAVAVFGDHGNGSLVLLDLCTALVLFACAKLPVHNVWPDLVVAGVNTAYVAMRYGDAVHVGSVSLGCQALAIFSMASAGVHTAALAGSLAMCIVTAPLLAASADFGEVLLCLYIIFTSATTEQRVAMLVADKSTSSFSYKSLDTVSRQEPLVTYSERYRESDIHKQHAAASRNGAALEVKDPAYDPEEGLHVPPPPPAATDAMDGRSLTDYVLSKMPRGEKRQQEQDPERGGQDPERSSRRGPVSAITSLISRGGGSLTTPRQKFAASQLEPLGAATHEAPSFAPGAKQQASSERDALLSTEEPPPDATMTRTTPPPSGGLGISSSEEKAGSTLPADPPPGAQRSATADVATSSPPPTDTVAEAAARTSQSSAAADGEAVAEAEAAAPKGGDAAQSKTAFRGVKLRGFKNAGINVLFVENSEPQCLVNDRETYWATGGDYFVYRSAATNTWGVALAKRFAQVKSGKNNGLAHSPEGFEIWNLDQSATQRPWREFDTEAGKWLTRPNSGVESRGKVRKRQEPQEKGTQTERSPVASKDTQVEPYFGVTLASLAAGGEQ